MHLLSTINNCLCVSERQQMSTCCDSTLLQSTRPAVYMFHLTLTCMTETQPGFTLMIQKGKEEDRSRDQAGGCEQQF